MSSITRMTSTEHPGPGDVTIVERPEMVMPGRTGYAILANWPMDDDHVPWQVTDGHAEGAPELDGQQRIYQNPHHDTSMRWMAAIARRLVQARIFSEDAETLVMPSKHVQIGGVPVRFTYQARTEDGAVEYVIGIPPGELASFEGWVNEPEGA